MIQDCVDRYGNAVFIGIRNVSLILVLGKFRHAYGTGVGRSPIGVTVLLIDAQNELVALRDLIGRFQLAVIILHQRSRTAIASSCDRSTGMALFSEIRRYGDIFGRHGERACIA